MTSSVVTTPVSTRSVARELMTHATIAISRREAAPNARRLLFMPGNITNARMKREFYLPVAPRRGVPREVKSALMKNRYVAIRPKHHSVMEGGLRCDAGITNIVAHAEPAWPHHSRRTPRFSGGARVHARERCALDADDGGLCHRTP